MQRVYEFQENAHKFQKKGYSSIIPFMHEGKEDIHKYMQFEVCMAVRMNKLKKGTKMAVRITKYLMCTCGGQRCTSMKLLYLILWQGELCTDADTNTNTDTNDNAG